MFKAVPLILAFTTSLAALAQPTVPNFRLLDSKGRSHELYRQPGEQVLLYIYAPGATADADLARLEAFAAEHNDLRILLIAPERTRVQAANKLPFPLLQDDSEIVLHALDATHANELFVVSTKDWSLTHRGAIPEGAALGEVVNAAASASPAKPLAPLDLLPLPTPDYAKDVAPILAAKCANCHQKGDAAPFAFDSHRRAAGWAEMTKEVLLTDRMPPWFADPNHGEFSNNNDLTPEEERTLVAWIDAGAPASEGADPLADREVKPKGEWQLGQPDLVLGMTEPFEVPAEGVLGYQLLYVPSGLTEDKWVRGLEVLPGNPAVVHHALIFIEYPEHLKAMEPRNSGGARGNFAGFVPGTEPHFLPEGTGKYVPAGSTFVFQIHYVTTGKPETDVTRLGLHFMDGPPKIRVETTAAFNAEFAIPPRDADYEVKSSMELRAPMMLYGLSPHMHYRGSRFKYIAHYPSGEREVLLSVPNYNFDWQRHYALAAPKLLPGGTRIRVVGAFDNSPQNPYNPNPDATVNFGEQTYDEMFIGYMLLGAPPKFYEKMAERREQYRDEEPGQPEPEDLEKAMSGTPLTPESIIGTLWREDEWKFRFKADGKFLVNDLIGGQWKWENNRVIIDVVGEHFELDVIGSGLFFNGRHPMERLE